MLPVMMRWFIICFQVFLDDQTKKYELGQECSTHGKIRNTYKLLFGNLKEREHSEDLGVDGK
jgi:hypothetical protein